MDSVHAEIGAEGLWAYMVHRIETISKEVGRNYIPIITRPHPSELFPKELNEVIDYFYDLTDSSIDSQFKEIEETELKDVKGKIIKVEDKKTEIRKRLKEIISKSDDIAAAVKAFQSPRKRRFAA